MKIKISNIRLNPATSSSSTHSAIIIKDSEIPEDDYGAGFGEYGWHDFILASEKAKLSWLAVTIKTALQERECPKSLQKLVIERLIGSDVFTDDEMGILLSEGYIDHQSLIRIPVSYNDEYFAEFIEALKKELLRHNLVLIGGNDNDDTDQWAKSKYGQLLINNGESALLDLADASGFSIKNSDGKGNFLLFNTDTGAKMTFSFDDDYEDDSSKIATKRGLELVDLSITDHCKYHCSYCYRGSTFTGKHANVNDIAGILNALGRMGVLEIVIGGGEPTLHPEFQKILKVAKECGFRVSVTTRNKEWLTNGDNDDIYDKLVDTIGYSVGSTADIAALYELYDAKLSDGNEWNVSLKVKTRLVWRVTYHIVMGTVARDKFVDILRLCEKQKLPIVLLGYKAIGRGVKFKPSDYSWWLDDLRQYAPGLLRSGKVSIDTKLAKEYQEKLSEISNKIFYRTKEGEHSCFIDATNETISASSYHPDIATIDYYEVYGEYVNREQGYFNTITKWWGENRKDVE